MPAQARRHHLRSHVVLLVTTSSVTPIGPAIFDGGRGARAGIAAAFHDVQRIDPDPQPMCGASYNVVGGHARRVDVIFDASPE